MTTMRQVSSTAVREIGYDPDARTMRVVYANGATYDYDDVAPETFDSLISSQSVGRDLRAAIQGKAYARVQ